MLVYVLWFHILSTFVVKSFGFTISPTPTTTSSLYPHSEDLDALGNVKLFWKTNDTHIMFLVQIKTKGWIAIGVSGNGNMYPADIAVGWITDNGMVHFGDYHTVDRSGVTKDLSQDWHLIDAEENSNGTSFSMTRKINTCDEPDDRRIQDGQTHIIYAYNEIDPVSDESITYHGAETRGTKSIWLLSTYFVPQNMPEDAEHLYFLMDNYFEQPHEQTVLHKQGFQVGDIGKHHIIKFEPVITSGNENHVHHISLYYAYNVDPALDPATNIHIPDKRQMFVWNFGGKAFYYPDNVGFSIGGSNDASFYIMEIHYNNLISTDSSGVRLTITKTLRQYEAGLLTIGITPGGSNMLIPPGQDNFAMRGYCGAQCLLDTMAASGLEELNVFSTETHAHKHAFAIKTRHFRNGTEISPLVQDPTFDYYFMGQRRFSKEISIRKGDSLIVECQYNTQDRSEVLMKGPETSSEMCLVFLMYYPRINMDWCTSSVLINDIIQFQAQQNPEYWNEETVEMYKRQVQSSSVRHKCGSDNTKIIDFVETAGEKSYQPVVSECP